MNAIPIRAEVYPGEGLRLTLPPAALLTLLLRPATMVQITVPGIGLVQLQAGAPASFAPLGLADTTTAHGDPKQDGYVGLEAWDVRAELTRDVHGAWVPSPVADAILTVLRAVRL